MKRASGDKNAKPIEKLTIKDLKSCAVWEFLPESPSRDETWVRPVESLPVADLGGKVVGTQVQLNDGTETWAQLGNVDVDGPKRTALFLTVAIKVTGGWFHLARYFDFDFDDRGPSQLATALDKDVDDIFPINYDIRNAAIGELGSVCGTIRKSPKFRLSQQEIMAMAVARRD